LKITFDTTKRMMLCHNIYLELCALEKDKQTNRVREKRLERNEAPSITLAYDKREREEKEKAVGR
jgi:hypothetical protein